MKKYLLFGIAGLLVLATIRGLFLLRQSRGGWLEPRPTPSPTLTLVPPTPTPTDEDFILASFRGTVPEHYLNLREGEKFRAVEVTVEGGWAVIEAAVVDADTGEPTVGEGTLVLFRKLNGTWEPAYRGTDRYRAWLDEIPETLVPADLKMLLR